MNVLDTTIEVKLNGGVTLSFCAPRAKQTFAALELMRKIKDAKEESEYHPLVFEELPRLLAPLLVAASSDRGSVPDDWRDQVVDLGYLSGATGVDVLQRVFFRSRVDDSGEGP